MITETVRDGLLEKLFSYTKDKWTWHKILTECKDQLKQMDGYERLPTDECIARVFDTDEFRYLEKSIVKAEGINLSRHIKQMLCVLFVSHGYDEELAAQYSKLLNESLKSSVRKEFPDRYQLDIIDEILDSVVEIKTGISALEPKINDIPSTVLELLKEGYIGKHSGTIVSINDKLLSNTSPKIDLSFFDFQDEEFSSEVEKAVLSGRNCIYIQGYSKEETLYCVLFVLSKVEILRDKVLVIHDQAAWDLLEGETHDCIYIPNFESNEIKPIEDNRTIYIYRIDQPAPNRTIIKLRNRLASNLSDKLYEVFSREGHDYSDVSGLLERTNGKFFAIKRELFKGQHSKPRWATQQNKIEYLLKAMLLGSWSDSDQEVIKEFLDPIPYNNFILYLTQLIDSEDPFLIQYSGSDSNNAYRITCPDEAWSCLKDKIPNTWLNEFEKLCTLILPYDSNSDGRIYSDAQDISYHYSRREPKCSRALREGLSNNLLLLKEHYKGNAVVDVQIRRIVDSVMASITDIGGWCYFSSYATILMEASPELILHRYEQEIKLGQSSPLLQLFERRLFVGMNEQYGYIYILSSLEVLFSFKNHIFRSIYCLCSLVDLDLKLLTGNSPNDSLRHVFCAWCHDSVLDVTQIKEVAKRVIVSYKNGWDIIAKELPDSTSSVVFGTRQKPRADYLREKIEIKHPEMTELFTYYTELCIEHARDDIDRWMILLDNRETFKFAGKASICKLKTIIPDLTDKNRKRIQNELRVLLSRNRKFRFSNRALPEEILEPINVLYDEIEFKDPIFEFTHLFKEYVGTDALEVNPPVWDENDEGYYRVNAERVNGLVRSEMERLKNSGIVLSRFIEMADLTGDMRLFGRIISEVYTPEGYDEEIFILLLKSRTELHLFRYYIEETYELHDRNPHIVLSALQSARVHNCDSDVIVTLAQIDYHVFDAHDIHEFLTQQEIEIFWETLSFQWLYRAEGKDIQALLDKSLEYNNGALFWKSFEKIQPELSPLQSLELFEKALEQRIKPQSQFRAFNEEQFKKFREQLDLAQYKQRIAQMELYFLEAHAIKNGTCFYDLITEDSGVYAHFIDVLYMHEGGVEPNRNEDEISKISYLFSALKFCPGARNGTVDENVLYRWVDQFKELLGAQQQSSLVNPLLGRLLAHSPIGDDGYEPHEAVRSLIEEIDHDDLLQSFQIERMNMRGFYTITGGKGEKMLAKQFQRNAEELNLDYPRTASIYFSLAKHYDSSAADRRVEAESIIY